MTQEPQALALAEYKALKAEQTARISTRDNLIYAVIIAIAGTLTVTHAAHSRTYLLIIPAVTTVLGWTYLRNDAMITAIGTYIREHPALPMGWEHDHRGDTRRTSRTLIQLTVDLAAFCGSALTALTAFWLTPQHAPLIAASALEALAAGVLAWQFTAYTRMPGTRHAPEPTR
jgi:hypothetical protein